MIELILVKLSSKRKMNRYIDYPEELEELLTTVIPQIYKMWLVKYVRELFHPIKKVLLFFVKKNI